MKAELSGSGEFGDVLDFLDTSEWEANCYSAVLPRAHALLQSIGDTSKLAAHCYHFNRSSRPRYLIFDDLKEKAFLNVDRRVGLDLDHMELVMNRLGKWHATTGYLGEVDPTIYKQRTIKPISEGGPFDAFFVSCMKSASEAVQKWSGCEKYAEKLMKLARTINKKGSQAFEKDEAGFNCLTHSDLWINNIMFKYNSKGGPEDVVFVDYSMGFHGSPGLDLAYFLFTSNVPDHGEADWDRMLRVYHNELVRVLDKLGYKKKVPSFLDIYIEFLKRAHYALLVATFLIPLRLVEDATHADISGLMGDSPEKVAFRRQIFSHPRYRSLLEPILKFCYNKGIMDA